MTATYATPDELLRFLNLEDQQDALNLDDDKLQGALDRAQAAFDDDTNNHFVNGGTATPAWNAIIEEKQRGKGRYLRQYYTEKYPIANITAELTSDAPAGGTTLYVDSTAGFPDTAYIGFGSNKFQYGSKTSTSFIGGTAVTSGTVVTGGSTGVLIKPYVVEISTTAQGSEPAFTTIDEDSDYDMDIKSGRFYLYNDDILLDVLTYSNPPKQVPNRVRVTYLWGNETIPDDVKHAVLMMASRDLMNTVVRRNTLLGQNEFNPAMLNVDEKFIQEAIDRHVNIKVVNDV